MGNPLDIIGKTFTNLTVLDICKIDGYDHQRKYKCQCKCGKIVYAYRSSLLSGRHKSCGCYYVPPHGKDHWNTKHGLTKTRIHHEWVCMRNRCNPNQKSYEKIKNYSYGRYHVTVCDEWNNDFMSFYNWSMANGYTDELTIDRIDNTKGYSPDNCRWVTAAEQQRNKTNTIKIIHNGKLTPLCVVCKEYPNIGYKLAHARYSKLLKKGKENITTDDIFYPRKKVPHNKRVTSSCNNI